MIRISPSHFFSSQIGAILKGNLLNGSRPITASKKVDAKSVVDAVSEASRRKDSKTIQRCKGSGFLRKVTGILGNSRDNLSQISSWYGKN
jgi:hypothetical protein